MPLRSLHGCCPQFGVWYTRNWGNWSEVSRNAHSTRGVTTRRQAPASTPRKAESEMQKFNFGHAKPARVRSVPEHTIVTSPSKTAVEQEVPLLLHPPALRSSTGTPRQEMLLPMNSLISQPCHYKFIRAGLIAPASFWKNPLFSAGIGKQACAQRGGHIPGGGKAPAKPWKKVSVTMFVLLQFKYGVGKSRTGFGPKNKC